MWVIWVFALLFLCVCVCLMVSCMQNDRLFWPDEGGQKCGRENKRLILHQTQPCQMSQDLDCGSRRIWGTGIWTAGPEGFGVPGFGLRVQKDLGYRDFRLLACRTAFILSSSSWKCRLGVSDHMSVVKCWRWSVGDKVLSDHVLMVKCWWVVGCKGLVLKCCWSVHLGTHGIFWIMRRKIWWHLTFFYTHLSGSVTSSVWM